MRKITSLLLVGILFLASCTKQDIPVPQQDVLSNPVSTTSVQTNSVGEGQFAYVSIEPQSKTSLVTKYMKYTARVSRFYSFWVGLNLAQSNASDLNKYIDIDIEIYEFVRACSKRDIKELIKELVDEEHLPKEIYNEKGEVKKEMIRRTSSEIEFSNNLDKLKEKYFSLNQEEELFLTKIFNKYN